MRVKTIVTGLLMILIGVGALVFTTIQATDIGIFRESARRQIAAAIGREFNLGSISIVFGWPPRIIATDAQLANTSWAADRPMVTFERLEGEVDPWSLLIGSVRLHSMTLFDGSIDLARSKEGVGNWVFETASPETPSFPASLIGLEQLTLRRFSVEMRDLDVGARWNFRVVRANIDLTARDTIEIDASGSWGDNPYEARLFIPRPRESQPAPFRPRLVGKIIGVEFDIGLQSPDWAKIERYEADLRVKSPSLSNIVMVLGGDIPQTPAVSGSARIRQVEGMLEFDQLTAQMGRSDVTGRVRFADPEGRTRIEGEIASGRLVSADMPDIGGVAVLGWIADIDTSFDWQIDAAELGEAELRGVMAHVESDRGGIAIETQQMALGDGNMQFEGKLVVPRSDDEATWNINGAFNDSNLGQILGLASLPALAEARQANGEFALNGPAQSMGAWLSGLSGQIRISAGPGGFRPKFSSFVPSSAMSFDCMHASLAIDRGLAIVRDWVAENSSELILLEGSVDLRGGIIDARSIALAKNEGPANFTRSIEINGPLLDPEPTESRDIAPAQNSRLAQVLGELSKDGGGDSSACHLASKAFGGLSQ